MGVDGVKRLQSTLGLIKRAGALAVGSDTVIDTIRDGKAKLVLTASDASEETLKKFTDKTAFYGVKCEDAGLTKEELGAAVGKSNAAAVAITNESFVRAFRASLERDNA